MINKVYIVLDLEATCYDREDKNVPKGFFNEIIEIGAVKCNVHGIPISHFQEFIKPTKFPVISKFCNELTTIKQEDIDEADSFKTVINKFWDWIGNHTEEIVPNVTYVSWGHYDKRQLRQDCQVNGIDREWINDKNHISLKHEHAIWNNIHERGVGLGKACKMEDISFVGTAHRGIDDAINIAKIFQKYIHKF